MRTELVQPIGELVRAQARSYGDKPFLVADARVETYRDHDARTDRIAGGLDRLGIHAGDRVATYMGNSIELLESYTAIAKLGALVVFVNDQLTPREASFILRDSGSLAVITDEAHLGNVEQVRDECPELREVVVAGPAFERLAAAEPVVAPPPGVDAPAWIAYTSGSTGLPKGALLTHRGVTWSAASCVEALEVTDADVVLCCLPLFHLYALSTCYLQILGSGATLVITDRFSPARVLELIEKHRVSVFPAVPAMLNYLCNFAGRTRWDLSSLRIAFSGGSVLTEQVATAFEAEFGIPVCDGWGSTETSAFAIFTRAGGTRVPGSCGLPLPGVAIRIVDGEGHDLPPGERGEMIVRGPIVMSGYLNRPEENSAALREGWYHTGDLAMLDQNGYVFIIDRIKDVMISGGYNIAPKEVEDVLISHPSVLEAAVIGMPDPALGEVVTAYIVLKEGAGCGVEELLSFCEERLAAYKMPRTVVFRDGLPKTPSGKLKRYELRLEATSRA